MEILLETYRTRLQSMKDAIQKIRFKDDANPDYIKLRIKAGCYQMIITELENEMQNNHVSAATAN
jgi:hypothetical protein